MTVAMRHGCPRLPLKPGVTVAEGYTAWRTFTRDADDNWLELAAEAARVAWGDDPVIYDLRYVEPVRAQNCKDDADATAGCCPDPGPCLGNEDPIHDACRGHERGQCPEDR